MVDVSEILSLLDNIEAVSVFLNKLLTMVNVSDILSLLLNIVAVSVFLSKLLSIVDVSAITRSPLHAGEPAVTIDNMNDRAQ
jgi:hypothetical protein